MTPLIDWTKFLYFFFKGFIILGSNWDRYFSKMFGILFSIECPIFILLLSRKLMFRLAPLLSCRFLNFKRINDAAKIFAVLFKCVQVWRHEFKISSRRWSPNSLTTNSCGEYLIMFYASYIFRWHTKPVDQELNQKRNDNAVSIIEIPLRRLLYICEVDSLDYKESERIYGGKQTLFNLLVLIVNIYLII